LNGIARTKFRENRSIALTLQWRDSTVTKPTNFLIRKARRLGGGLSGKVK